MSVVVTVGTNSYISVADATTYFSSQLYADSWVNAAADDQAKALIMATNKIDKTPKLGVKVLTSQALEFPRASYSDGQFPRYNIVGAAGYFFGDRWVVETTVSQEVKDATCEQAIFYLKAGANGNKRADLQAQGVKSFSIGGLSESFKVGHKNGLCENARELLSKYIGPMVII